MATLTEDELDILVSEAIRKAEHLRDAGSPLAVEAWKQVMTYEEQLANLTSPAGLPGGVARVGAVSAALAAGRRGDARRLAARFLAEDQLPNERRSAIQRALRENSEHGQNQVATSSAAKR